MGTAATKAAKQKCPQLGQAASIPHDDSNKLLFHHPLLLGPPRVCPRGKCSTQPSSPSTPAVPALYSSKQGLIGIVLVDVEVLKNHQCQAATVYSCFVLGLPWQTAHAAVDLLIIRY